MNERASKRIVNMMLLQQLMEAQVGETHPQSQHAAPPMRTINGIPRLAWRFCIFTPRQNAWRPPARILSDLPDCFHSGREGSCAGPNSQHIPVNPL